jgi:hypothetical protein
MDVNWLARSDFEMASDIATENTFPVAEVSDSAFLLC